MTNLFNKLKAALAKTSTKIGSGIEHLFIKKYLDESSLEELKDILLFADVGNNVSEKIISKLKKQKFNKEVTPTEIKQDLKLIITDLLSKTNHNFTLLPDKLNIILVCGVNGNGKTTTIGKMAAAYINEGKKVAIAACDTFRAAAVEQMEKWTIKSGAILYKGAANADPASVAYNAVTESINNKMDILFIDTAGRLHNQKNLMDELAKIIRVIKKTDITAPHHSLLIIDGTTGQNAITQVEQFQPIAHLSGIIITKLDGTAKAGALLGIVDKFGLPIHFVGVGEGIMDLKPFIASEFAAALLGLE